MKYQILKNKRLLGLSIPQATIICMTIIWFGFSLIQQAGSAIYSPLFGSARFAIFAFSIPITFLGTVLPLLIGFWLCLSVIQRMKRNALRVSIYKALRAELDAFVATVIIVMVILAPFYLLIEECFAFSIVPLTMPICGLLGACVGYLTIDRINSKDRLAIMALLLSLVLSTQYLDWNDIKPLLRDTYRIRLGMTVAEVESLMGNHKIGPGGPFTNDEETEPTGEGKLVYMTPHTTDMVRVKVKEGKVEGVEYVGD